MFALKHALRYLLRRALRVTGESEHAQARISNSAIGELWRVSAQHEERHPFGR